MRVISKGHCSVTVLTNGLTIKDFTDFALVVNVRVFCFFFRSVRVDIKNNNEKPKVYMPQDERRGDFTTAQVVVVVLSF